MRTWAIIGLASLAAVAAGQSGPHREGAFWVETFTGSEPVPAAGRLRVASRGRVIVTGGDQENAVYELKARVKAANEAEARRRLSEFAVRASRRAQYTLMTVQQGGGEAELTVRCPRSLREAIVSTVEESVRVSDLDGSVRAETAGGPISIDRIGGSVTCVTGGGDIRLGNIDGAVHCTTGGGPITAGVIRGEAILETGAGDIKVEEIGGLARVSTGGGSVVVRRAGSAVIASTMGGPIQIGRAGGMVTARNSGGSVEVGEAMGVRCESAGGGIHLANVSGSLRASTLMGTIVAQLMAGQPLKDSFLSTNGGDIVVRIPSNVGVTIRAMNELSDNFRRIVSDFSGVTVRREGGRLVAEGAINGGGPVLQISGTGGTIFIRRQQ